MAPTLPCVACGGNSLLELQMTAAGGQIMTMISCNQCEHRSWLADGEPVSLSEVLKITANDPDFVVIPGARKSRAPR